MRTRKKSGSAWATLLRLRMHETASRKGCRRFPFMSGSLVASLVAVLASVGVDAFVDVVNELR